MKNLPKKLSSTLLLPAALLLSACFDTAASESSRRALSGNDALRAFNRGHRLKCHNPNHRSEFLVVDRRRYEPLEAGGVIFFASRSGSKVMSAYECYIVD